jgi:anti-anti-sigma regulatory factor
MREIGGKLVLTNVQAQPMKVLKAAGIEQIAEIKGGGTK